LKPFSFRVTSHFYTLFNIYSRLRRRGSPIFLVTGQDAYDLKIYPNDASCVQGTRTEEGFLEITQDAVPGVIWEFRNPEPGVMRDLQVTKKLGTVSET